MKFKYLVKPVNRIARNFVFALMIEFNLFLNQSQGNVIDNSATYTIPPYHIYAVFL
jgi:hypothetical protein